MKKKATVEEVPPAEDLMREHGMLDRILLIYDEILWRLCQKTPISQPKSCRKAPT